MQNFLGKLEGFRRTDSSSQKFVLLVRVFRNRVFRKPVLSEGKRIVSFTGGNGVRSGVRFGGCRGRARGRFYFDLFVGI